MLIAMAFLADRTGDDNAKEYSTEPGELTSRARAPGYANNYNGSLRVRERERESGRAVYRSRPIAGIYIGNDRPIE